jgi:hypothetical protein
MRLQDFQQSPGKIRQAFWIQSDGVAMFVTRCREQITSVLAFAMFRAMPWTIIETAKLQQLLTLLLIQFSPEIHWLEFRWSSNFSLFRRRSSSFGLLLVFSHFAGAS